MGWSNVQHTSGTTTGQQFASNTTTHNTVIAVCQADTAVTVSSVSISPGGGTFSKLIAKANGSIPCEIWGCADITGGTTPTVTVTYSGGTGSPNLSIYEFSGGPTTFTTDGTNSSTGTSASMTTGAITTTVDGDLVIKGFNCGGTANGTVESGWTEQNPNATGNGDGFIVQSAHGSITGTMTQSPSSGYTGCIVALKPPGGSTVTLPSTTMQAALGITTASLKGLIAGGATVNMQAKLGITTATLKGLIAGGASVNMQGKFGIAGQIGKLAISLANLRALLGIASAQSPGKATGQDRPYSMWGGGF